MFNSIELTTIKELSEIAWNTYKEQVDDEFSEQTCKEMFILDDIISKINDTLGLNKEE